MAAVALLWEMPTMAKKDVPKGISARLEHLFERAKPADLSVRQLLIQSNVNTSFFTDISNGREPGIDKIERLANRCGLRLSELLAEADAPSPGRLAVPIALPSADRLRAAVEALVEPLDLSQGKDAIVDEIALLLPNALEQAGAKLVSDPSGRGNTRAARSQPSAKADRGSK